MTTTSISAERLDVRHYIKKDQQRFMNRIWKHFGIPALFASGAAIGATQACEIDLSKALEGQPKGASIKVAVKGAACVSVEGEGLLTVSDADAIKPEVIEWKDLGGGAREASVFKLTRQKAGTYLVYVQRSGVTNVFVVTD